tara:strand:- start:2307 stop:2891 length:585 start_codon:yes stop_codon:yes gene_type:complete
MRGGKTVVHTLQSVKKTRKMSAGWTSLMPSCNVQGWTLEAGMSKGTVNKVILIGNLGADPEVRQTQNGTAVANLRLATTRVSGTGSQRKESTEWHSVVCFDRLADLCAQYLQKGRKVYLEGRLHTRDWIDQKTGDKRYKTEIVARDLTFLGGDGAPQRGSGLARAGGGDGRDIASSTPAAASPTNQWRDDDVPF